jgi:hypothetical protein
MVSKSNNIGALDEMESSVMKPLYDELRQQNIHLKRVIIQYPSGKSGTIQLGKDQPEKRGKWNS